MRFWIDNQSSLVTLVGSAALLIVAVNLRSSSAQITAATASTATTVTKPPPTTARVCATSTVTKTKDQDLGPGGFYENHLPCGAGYKVVGGGFKAVDDRNCTSGRAPRSTPARCQAGS
jgi:hypothetical protein